MTGRPRTGITARCVPDPLPTADDRAAAELMRAHHEPGELASWISPTNVSINKLPVEYDYVGF